MSNGKLLHQFQIGVYTPPVVTEPGPDIIQWAFEDGALATFEDNAAAVTEDN